MSSETSIEKVRLESADKVRLKPDRLQPDTGFNPWHFFVLGSLAAATAAVLLSRRATAGHLILISLAIAAAGFVGFACYRALAPLVEKEGARRREPLGRRSRAAIEREKTLTLRAIKELEFDRAMGKLAEKDFAEMAARLRARALALMRQLEEGPEFLSPAPRKKDSRSLCACGTQNDADARFCKRCGAKIAALLIALFLPVAAAAQALQMPDPKQMSGVPLPSGELPGGTVSVRLVRGGPANNLSNHPVELTVAGEARRGRTDANGRAQFVRVPAGVEVRARAVVGDERLESQAFTMPRAGGVRLMLVASDPAAAALAAESAALAAGPAQPGTVLLGGDSRIAIEPVEEALEVFYLLEIVNNARTPVSTPAPLVFELPQGASGATMLEGSTPQASAGGKRVSVAGPFAPGRTPVRIAYRLPHSGGTVTLTQPLPATLEQVMLVAKKIPGGQLISAQAPNQRELPMQEGATGGAAGQTYIVAGGPAVKAGDALRITLTGLPGHPRWPRFMALTLAALILAAGFVSAWSAGRASSRSGTAAPA